MTILYMYSTELEKWVPMADAPTMATLLLRAQLLESIGKFTMFQWGVNYELFANEEASDEI